MIMKIEKFRILIQPKELWSSSSSSDDRIGYDNHQNSFIQSINFNQLKFDWEKKRLLDARMLQSFKFRSNQEKNENENKNKSEFLIHQSKGCAINNDHRE